MTDKDIEVTTVNNEAEDEETKPVEVYSEKADAEAPVLDSEQIKAAGPDPRRRDFRRAGRDRSRSGRENCRA